MKTNVDYSSLIVSYDDEGNEVITPITIVELLTWLCNYYGIELGTYPSVNNDYEISVFDNTKSGKFYISLIAEHMGGMVHIGRDNKLYIIPLKQTSSIEIDATASKSWSYSSTYEITGVCYDNGVTKILKGDETGNVLYLRQDNMFFLDNLETCVENIYNAVVGTRIDSLKIVNYGDPSLDCYDLLTYTLDDETYYTFANTTLTYEQNIASTIETSIPTTQQQSTTNVVGAIDTKEQIRKILSTINQDEATLDIIANRTSTNETNIANLQITTDSIELRVENTETNLEDNYSTTSQVEQMVLNASSGLTNTFSEAGGNNIFKNTDFYAQDVLEDNQVYEYWYGNVEKLTNTSAANGYSIYLKADNLYQEQTVANGNYTVSFYYKILNSLANVSVKINDKEYSLTNTDTTLFQTGTDDIEAVVVTSNSIKVEFISDVDDACEIYDIMVNAGTTKLAYSQNQNETITSTVKISEAIVVSSTKDNTEFVASPTKMGFRDTTTGELTTRVLPNGMSSDNLEVEDSANIVGVVRKKVGSQVWDFYAG